MSVVPRKLVLALGILLAIFDPIKLPALRPQVPQAAEEKPPAGSPVHREPTSLAGSQARPPRDQILLVTAVDENSVPVPFAQLTLSENQGKAILKGETDSGGRFKFNGLHPGSYRLQVQKEGFYVVNINDVRVGETESVEVALNHQQEFVEVMNVTASPATIDPAKTAAAGNLSNRDIEKLPYKISRDIRYALPLLPGVLQGPSGQVHINGSDTRQIVDQLDGFNITDPVNGLFKARVSIDAIRSAQVLSSRASAAYGKGSGGTLDLTTGMGDDRLRVSGTDFIPSLQTRRGIQINTWTPRVSFSGPLRKGKAWFLEALDGEYALNLLKDLPAGADRNPVWRVSNLSKAQVNLSEANLLTTSLLVNRFRAAHAGLSPFNPLQSTVTLGESAYFLTIKDQARLSSGMLLETGLGVSRFQTREWPQGSLPYVIRPEGASGSFFETASGRAGRLQVIGHLIAPPVEWRGRHEVQTGVDLDRIIDHQSFARRPFTILREDGTLSRQISFGGGPPFQKNNFEMSAFVQDRWSLSDRLLLESGVRLDRDQILRRPLLSPRVASTYLLTSDGDTKLSAGIGLYYDSTNLELITRSLAGPRFDLVFAKDGQTPLQPPIETLFEVNERALKGQRFVNWSVGLERKLPHSVYGQVDFLEKQGSNGWTYVQDISPVSNPSNIFELLNARRNRYDAAQVSLRRTFKGDHVLFASYTRSVASSNAVLDFSVNNAVFSQQAGGRLPWDSPSRFLTWGVFPVGKGFDIAYSLDWRDGYPFSVFNQNQQLVGPPSSYRFPAYFSLDVFLERRLRLLGFWWDARAGFNDITNRHNPSAVNNNVDSSRFLTFGGIDGETFTGRLRLLGRK